MDKLSRRTFVKVAGAATGAAAVAAAPGIARAAGSDEAVEMEPTTAVPDEPLVAYVRDLERGEITVVSGKHEITYRDHTLVQRLRRAARKGVR